MVILFHWSTVVQSQAAILLVYIFVVTFPSLKLERAHVLFHLDQVQLAQMILVVLNRLQHVILVPEHSHRGLYCHPVSYSLHGYLFNLGNNVLYGNGKVIN